MTDLVSLERKIEEVELKLAASSKKLNELPNGLQINAPLTESGALQKFKTNTGQPGAFLIEDNNGDMIGTDSIVNEFGVGIRVDNPFKATDTATFEGDVTVDTTINGATITSSGTGNLYANDAGGYTAPGGELIPNNTIGYIYSPAYDSAVPGDINQLVEQQPISANDPKKILGIDYVLSPFNFSFTAENTNPGLPTNEGILTFTGADGVYQVTFRAIVDAAATGQPGGIGLYKNDTFLKDTATYIIEGQEAFHQNTVLVDLKFGDKLQLGLIYNQTNSFKVAAPSILVCQPPSVNTSESAYAHALSSPFPSPLFVSQNIAVAEVPQEIIGIDFTFDENLQKSFSIVNTAEGLPTNRCEFTYNGDDAIFNVNMSLYSQSSPSFVEGGLILFKNGIPNTNIVCTTVSQGSFDYHNISALIELNQGDVITVGNYALQDTTGPFSYFVGAPSVTLSKIQASGSSQPKFEIAMETSNLTNVVPVSLDVPIPIPLTNGVLNKPDVTLSATGELNFLKNSYFETTVRFLITRATATLGTAFLEFEWFFTRGASVTSENFAIESLSSQDDKRVIEFTFSKNMLAGDSLYFTVARRSNAGASVGIDDGQLSFENNIPSASVKVKRFY